MEIVSFDNKYYIIYIKLNLYHICLVIISTYLRF